MPLPRSRHVRTLAVVVFALIAWVGAGQAQTPRVHLKFDGNTSDSSGAGIVTGVTAAGFSGSGGAPTFTTDRHGVANRALVLPGSSSLQLIASGFSGNSNQALGLRTAGGTNTPFTLAAWVYVNSVSGSSGYNVIFGNSGTGGGTLHAGLNNNRAHFGFDGNDANGNTVGFDSARWYHVAFVYDGANQRIYINGVPEVTRAQSTNTLKVSDLFIGNWNTATHSPNDLVGRLDDVLVYNVALSVQKVQALYNGVDPAALPAGQYSAPKLPGFAGGEGFWGIREIRGYSGISYGTLVNADRIINAYPATPSGTKVDYAAPIINMTDDEDPGNLGNFSNEADFATNTGSPDDNFLMIAKGTVRITEEADYTFGFLGDDGSRLRVLGQTFLSANNINGSSGNPANPAFQGDGLFWPAGTGNSGLIGVVHLVPGDYNLEFVWWEGGGDCAVEVFAAQGAKTAFDSSFQLIGNTAAGGLELVRDPDSYPQIPVFTVNGGSALFVHGGSPSSFTLAWQTNAVATSVNITPAPGAVGQSGSQVFASPAATTTYTITASNGPDVATKTATVYVNSAPVIHSFTANDTTVTAGSTVTLNWSVSGATELRLDPGNINVTGQTSRLVNPSADTTYTLRAINVAGTTSQNLFVDVGLPPVIQSFAVSDTSPLYGAEVFLNWNVANVDTVAINQGVGPISGATGSVSVTPVQTTVYTLTATNIYGTSNANATVNQPQPFGVLAPGFSVRRVSATTPFPFAGQSYLQSAVSLLGGQNAGASAGPTTYPRVNFVDGGSDGDFSSGVAFPGGSGDNFAVQITATLVINTPGEYTFIVSSDDGARLRINGQDVISDDSTHTANTKSGRVVLTGATATLELIHYDVTGGAEVELGWIRPNQTFQLLEIITPAAPIVRGQVLISEFMADNGGSLLDDDGDSSDWIEVWNSTNAPVNLAGYYLTDQASVPNKWAFPSRTLAANEYLVVFASGKNRTNPANPLHANFSLATTGEYLALTRDNGAGGFIVVSEFAPTFPAQIEDISYGSSDAEGYIGYMEVPTPGQPNARTVAGFAVEPSFSHQRGRYAAPFNLVLSTSTPGATIRYTTNGSVPTASSGLVYSGPVNISGTTTIRAATFRAGWKSSEIATQTYLFIDDIVTQTADTAIALGFPGAPVNGQVYRYGLNLANVTAGGGNLQSLKNALAAAPSVCLTTNIADFASAATGIYSNPGRRGLFWERPVSMEYINAAGTSEFQIDCGIRIRGGASRAVTNPKHAFHLYFRGSLYDGDLKYRLFGLNGAAQFDQIDLRCEQNYSWSKDNSGQNTLMREEWSRLSQRDMGQPYARTAFFHLYINGIYWGVFNFEERTEAAFGSTYLGGEKDNFDTVKSAGSAGSPTYSTEMTDGNFIAWRSLFDQCVALKNDNGTEASRTARYLQLIGRNPDGSPNAAFPVLLDPDNLIDYLLVVFFDGSFDSPMSTFIGNASNNWFGVRDRTGTRGFAYFAHDHEHGMDSQNNTNNNPYNRVGPCGGSGANGFGQTQYGTREAFERFNPQYVHELLCFSAEYRQRFADRVQRHFFNGGALTTTGAVARINELTAEIDPIIHAEAARWGSTGLHRNTWLNARNTVLNFINNGGLRNNIPAEQTVWSDMPRASLIVEQLKGYQDPTGTPKALFSTLLAPAFSGPFGGAVANPHQFSISNPNGFGTIYYTVNAADPRAIGGGITAGALTGASPISVTLNSSSTVRARIYNSATQQWSPLVEADYLVGTLASATNLAISKLHYHPPDTSPDAEFLEVMNIGASTVDLTNVRFTIGVQFQFPAGYLLAPGGRAVVVRDLAAFNAVYPSVPAGQIAGVYTDALSNSGEQLRLVAANDAVIRDFSYIDEAPWPEAADGDGPCLVLLRPETNPDHGNPANWRASSTPGGSPGASEATRYAAWASVNNVTDPNGDDDFDGTSNFGEYAGGTNPKSANPPLPTSLSTQMLNVDNVVAPYLVLSYRRPVGRDDAGEAVFASGELASWQAAVRVGQPVYHGDGTETVSYRHPQPRTGATRQFLQVRFTKLP